MKLLMNSFIFANFLSSVFCKADDFLRVRKAIDDNNAKEDFVVSPECGQIRGKKFSLKKDEFSLEDVVQFLGIPYAKPPIGNLRWKRSVAREKIKGIYDATRFRSVCPQSLNGPLPNVLLPVWYDASNEFLRNRTRDMNEDCLYLNVYTPLSFFKHVDVANHKVERLPVMVYVHGFTYSEGSGNFYDGSVLAGFGKVVVVTFNYRLGVLGFLSTLDENIPGNYGLWDQLLLLQWVKSNIWAFGGDPEQVTLFGSGAGAASIEFLMLSIRTDGKELFNKAILQSGSALAPWALVKNPRKYAKALANDPKIKCPTNTMSLMLRCLRNTSWKFLIKSKVNPTPFNLAFGPVVDGGNEMNFLSHSPFRLLSSGEFTKINVMIGVTQADGFGYVRDRLRDCVSCSMFNKSTSFFASKALYDEKNFNNDISSFVRFFYKSSNTTLIEEIIKFLYTDWTSTDRSSESMMKSLLQLYTDRQWVEPAVEKANLQAAYFHPAFFYTFSHYPGSDVDRSWVKCALGEEIPLVFGAPHMPGGYSLFPYNFTTADSMISLAVITYWANFAKNGNPMVGKHQEMFFGNMKPNYFQGVTWPRYEKDTKPYLDISIRPGIYHHYRAEKMAFWYDFLPRIVGFSGFKYQIRRNNLPHVKKRTKGVTSNPALEKRKSSKPTDSGDNNVMDMQLSMTLVVGFVLLFVNIIAFAIVSYRKEKDKYKIEKLQSQLKAYKRKNAVNKNGAVAISSSEQVVLEHQEDKLQKITNGKTKSVGGSSEGKKTYCHLPIAQSLPKYSDVIPLSSHKKSLSESKRNPALVKSVHAEPKLFDESPHYSGSKAHSVSSLISPRQINSFDNKKDDQNRPQSENVLFAGGIGNFFESEKLSWSRSERGNSKACTSKITFGPVCGTETLPKGSSALPAKSSGLNSFLHPQPLRCRSAMGIYPPQESEYGSILKRDNQHSSFCYPTTISNSGRERKEQSLGPMGMRPLYHGSVQHLPCYYSREVSLNSNGTFIIPRPTTITATGVVTDPELSQFKLSQDVFSRNSNENKNGRILQYRGFSSVMTKL